MLGIGKLNLVIWLGWVISVMQCEDLVRLFKAKVYFIQPNMYLENNKKEYQNFNTILDCKIKIAGGYWAFSVVTKSPFFFS